MSQLEAYRNSAIKKREEIAKLNGDLAKEQNRISSLQKKILSAKDSISRTKSQTTIKSKLREIEQISKTLAGINKRCSDYQKKIAQKEKELAAIEKNMHSEEKKENKKKAVEEKKHNQKQAFRFDAIEQDLHIQALKQTSMQTDIDNLMAVPDRITVLFMAANPNGTSQLRLDEEVRAVQEKIRLSEYRDSIHFESRWAVRSSDVLQAINETNPTIVHFSGHGTVKGDLVLTNPDGSAKMYLKKLYQWLYLRYLIL